MKIKTPLLIIFCLAALLKMNSQELTEKQKERANNKVEIYTSEERDNLQMGFYMRVKAMNLPAKIEDQYYSIVLYYTMKMARLDDKDKELPIDEIKVKFEKYVSTMNSEIKEVLSEGQYKMHLENFDKIIYSVNRKLNSKEKN